MQIDDVVSATVSAIKRAEVALPDWVTGLIEEAEARESNELARSHLRAILENVKIARQGCLPLCQDTGLQIFHIEIGRDAKIEFSLNDAVSKGVRQATACVPLRPNAVDPLSRKNSGDNTGSGIPHILTSAVDGDGLRITAYPKGAGSENMSFIGMLNPADDPLDFVLEGVAKRAANACPPVFVGVGIGGTFDLAASMAKRALMQRPGRSPLEMSVLWRINDLGIGPMGLGGDTTALGVRILTSSCHTASLPVAVNFQCWANRSASCKVWRDGWSIE